MKTTTIRKTIPITIELMVEVSGQVRQPDADVGEFGPQFGDVTIERIGTSFNEYPGTIDWATKFFGDDSPVDDPLSAWLTGCIIEQCGDLIEEQLLDDPE